MIRMNCVFLGMGLHLNYNLITFLISLTKKLNTAIFCLLHQGYQSWLRNINYLEKTRNQIKTNFIQKRAKFVWKSGREM